MRTSFPCRTVLTVLLIVLTLLTLGFVFGNSLDSSAESQAKSSAVKEMIRPVLEWFLPPEALTDHLVRKAAHFIEFCALGVGLTAVVWILQPPQRRIDGAGRLLFWILPLFLGLLAALTDETIQVYSARGSQVQDVWLDFFGVCTGVLLMQAVRGLCAVCRRHKE